jgi:hypothetical protein
MLAEDHSIPGPVSMRDKCVPMGSAFIESGCNKWRTLSLKSPRIFRVMHVWQGEERMRILSVRLLMLGSQISKSASIGGAIGRVLVDRQPPRPGAVDGTSTA